MRFGSAPWSRVAVVRAGVALAAIALPASLCFSQATPAATSGPTPSRFDIYGGYLYWHPFSESHLIGQPYEDVVGGAVASVSYYIKPHFGIQAEASYSPETQGDGDCVTTAQAGPIFRFQVKRLTPYVHATGGLSKIGAPQTRLCNITGYGGAAGGGVDYILPVFHNRLAVRLFQVDYTYGHQNDNIYGPADIYALRASAGLVLRLGSFNGEKGQGTTMTCSADPSEPFPGDPVTLSASVLNIQPSKVNDYQWSSSGGTVRGTDATVTLDTAGLAPGNYNVSGHLLQGTHRREAAACTASFTVRSPLPPVVSCKADRAAINSGDPVTITTTASSPSNRPLTYSYTATNGQVAGAGATAMLSTAGSTPGTITVTCAVADDKGMSSSATASVVVATPVAPPPAAVARNLCSIAFERDKKRPDRVDNEAKGCLDDIALTLQRETTAKVVLVGNHAGHETNKDAAARAMNASDYLTKEKGIDPTRLELRTSDVAERTVTSTLVPAGATFESANAATFDASTIQRHGQAYGIPGQKRTAKPHKKRRRRAVAATNQAAPL